MNKLRTENATLRQELERARTLNGELTATIYGMQDGCLIRDLKAALQEKDKRIAELERLESK